jgi:hypothetical protein
MMEVRIRTADEATPVHFADIDASQGALEKLLHMINTHGFRSEISPDGFPVEYETQFVLDESGAYFEIVLQES